MTESASYRPLSGPAVAGFGLAILYTLGMAVLAGVALYTGVPMLLDQLAVLWPVGAFVLSLAGWLQINRSEGTRAGLPLARWGMLLSAIVGLCYLSWRIAKEQAVKAEAQSFTDEWLDRLRRSQPYTLDSYVAFWNILDPDRRDPRFPLADARYEEQLRQRPAGLDELAQYVKVRYVFGGGDQGSKYQRLINHDLFALISPVGKNARCEAKGIRSWTYLGTKQGGYQVDLNYDIVTPEGTFPAVISVLSSEGSKDEGRVWQVLLEGTGLAPPGERKLSALGANVMALRLDSREFARDWVRKLGQGHRDEAFLDTRPPAERPVLRQLAQAGPVTASAAGAANGAPALWGGLVSLADAEAARVSFLPEFARFRGGDLVNDQGLVADPSIKPIIGAGMRAMYRPWPQGSLPLPLVAENGTQLTSPWRADEARQEIVFLQPFGGRLLSNHVCEGFIWVVSSDPAVSAAVSDPAASPVSLPLGQRPLRWRIVRVELTVGSVLSPRDSQR